jgi:hypothetical protein
MKSGWNWKAGVAATAITPAEPMWLAGWAARREPATGRSTELFAKALALQDAEGSSVLIITADLIAIPREVAQQVSAQLQAGWGIPRERILLNASHTHTGPEVRPDKVPFFEIPAEYAAKIGPYVSGLVEKMISVGNAALESLEPVTLTLHEAKAEFARNRRCPEGPRELQVPILEVNRALLGGSETAAADSLSPRVGRRAQEVPAGSNQNPLALLFGYACHNLTLPPSFCQFHGDYAGVAQQYLEESFPGATALFLAGAGADQDPFPRGAPEWAEQHGRALGLAVEGSLETPGRAVSGRLGAGYREVLLDFAPVQAVETLERDLQSEDLPLRRKAAFLLSALREKRPLPVSYPCPVQVLHLGNELLLIALGGEPTVEYALQFKATFAGPQVWVAGYCNDMFGYVPTRRIQREGGYEGGRAMLWSALPGPFTETVEERVVEAVRRLVAETKAESQSGS